MGCPGLTTYDYFASVEAQPKSADRRNDDGCMLTNGGWTYSWNCENRLISATNDTNKLEFSYDYMGRRVEKKTYTGSSGNWTLATHLRFVYDGYLQIEELDALDADTVAKAYVWEPGGQRLLSSVSYTSNNLNQYTSVEAKPKSAHRRNANKNVTELLDDTGTVRAHYEYSPFGKITAMTGDKAADNPFRFSSEYHDDETALVYYNYRYYSPELGRWLKRDPIEERGGVNLYGMTKNDTLNAWDYIGLLELIWEWGDEDWLHSTLRPDYTARPGNPTITDPDAYGKGLKAKPKYKYFMEYSEYIINDTCCCEIIGSTIDVDLHVFMHKLKRVKIEGYWEQPNAVYIIGYAGDDSPIHITGDTYAKMMSHEEQHKKDFTRAFNSIMVPFVEKTRQEKFSDVVGNDPDCKKCYKKVRNKVITHLQGGIKQLNEEITKLNDELDEKQNTHRKFINGKWWIEPDTWK